MSTLQEHLKQHGHDYDVIVPDELFEEHRDELHRTKMALPKDGPTFRDDRPRDSVHVTDCRNTDRGDLPSCVVGHLEHFNPEHHPLLHALVDYPLWWWKNRIREYNNP